ncbi:unnamed protein product [Mycena citricolor]|uniref:Uncharacterized protein n=1 Tax=Mycena citricolor TaxID=2018698 RepID=A0AAD2K3S0_9AGAR|nr:unnamed protein product [Mycena citricolor]
MPKRKANGRIKNLGSYAKEGVSKPPKRPRTDSEPVSQACSNESGQEDGVAEGKADSGDDDSGDELLDIEVEDDVLQPKDEKSLQGWLKVTADHLQSLCNHAPNHLRGQYATNKLDKAPEKRTVQHHAKQKRDQAQREAREDQRLGLKLGSLLAFFKPRTLVPSSVSEPSVSGIEPEDSDMEMNDVELLEITETTETTQAVEPMQSMRPPPRPSVKEVPEDEDLLDCAEPAVLDDLERAEEGLDDIWDPSEKRLPGYERNGTPSHKPANPSRPPPPSPPPPDDPPSGDTPHPVPRAVPSNTSIDAGIPKLQDLLHPRWAKGQGHSKSKLDLVTYARMECVIRFLRLYCAAGYSGWSLYSEMIASSSGKQGTKTWMARKLREWAIDFCGDSKLPTHLYGRFTSTILADEDIAVDIHLHLQSLGKWVSAKQIVRYVATPEFQA